MYADDLPLEAQGNDVHDIHVQRDQQTSRALIPPTHALSLEQASHTGETDSPQRRRSETQRAPDVHGIPQHVKREPLHAMVHQDPKVIPKERPRDPECVGRGDDKQLTDGKHDHGDRGRIRLWKQRHARLVAQRALVPVSVVAVRFEHVGRGCKTRRTGDRAGCQRGISTRRESNSRDVRCRQRGG